MAYRDHELEPVREGLKSPTEFVYQTADGIEAVSADDYFLAARARLRRNDLIRVVADAAGERPAHGTFVVTRADHDRVLIQTLADLDRVQANGHTWGRVRSLGGARPGLGRKPKPAARKGA